MKVAVIYCSTTGNTSRTALAIARELGQFVDTCCDLEDIDFEALQDYDVLILGVPTWGLGELECSWEARIGQLDRAQLPGKHVAFFGHGDQGAYAYNFQDAMGILREKFIAAGATAEIGHWSTEGYTFEESRSVVDGRFVGLPLDNDNQPELTEERIEQWCYQLKRDLGLIRDSFIAPPPTGYTAQSASA